MDKFIVNVIHRPEMVPEYAEKVTGHEKEEDIGRKALLTESLDIFIYWEPAWIPVPGSGWATPESLEYIKESGPCGNEWANQALFDYDGYVLPALKTIRDF